MGKGKGLGEGAMSVVAPCTHRAPQGLREQIEKHGLRADRSQGFTEAGKWAEPYYPEWPVFIATEPWQGEGDLWQVEVEGIRLYPDLPSLVDKSGVIEEHGVWFEDQAIQAQMAEAYGVEEDELIEFSEILEHPEPAIRLTGTAAVCQPIKPERLKLIT